MNKKIIYSVLGISCILCIICGGLLLYVFEPLMNYKINTYTQKSNITAEDMSQGKYDENKEGVTEEKTARHLVIPKIGVDIPIVENQDERGLLFGAWHYPETAVPGESGNMVITGHRFRFRPPNNKTFYLLDKLEPGDIMTIFWDKKEYKYIVKKNYIVPDDQLSILDRGTEEKITLFTCTPLFTQKDRLVIEAVPVE